MKKTNQMTITDSAVLKFSGSVLGGDFYEACSRLFSSASMLPVNSYIGVRIKFDNKEIPCVSVFSNASLAAEDYAWMFKPCADVFPQAADYDSDLSGMTEYLFAGSSANDYGKSFDSSILTDELRELGAVLSVVVPSGSGQACVSLRTYGSLPLRLRVMLSCSFRCAEIREADENADESAEGIPRAVAVENLSDFLYAIANKDDKFAVYECLEEDELELIEYCPASIDELGLSIRSYNCLKRAGINTIDQLRSMKKEELIRVRNLGRKNYREVIDKLDEYVRDHVPAAELPETEENEKSGKELLDELIGLDGVKAQVRRISALARMQQDMKASGKKAEPITLNMSFTGNPGTAKTTVARILAKIFCELGLLENASPVEVGRADIVGRYTGQTADNVKTLFQKAKGSLLFIDEAYSLLEYWENGYGDEAINAIVQEMENSRADTVVVFAGYPEPMEEFLSRNPGLRSRVPFAITFADYSPEEMTQIAVQHAERRGFSFTAGAMDRLGAICSEACRSEDNGNGRFCRNLVENAILSYAERVYGDDADAPERDFVLHSEDLSGIQVRKAEIKRAIGF